MNDPDPLDFSNAKDVFPLTVGGRVSIGALCAVLLVLTCVVFSAACQWPAPADWRMNLVRIFFLDALLSMMIYFTLYVHWCVFSPRWLARSGKRIRRVLIWAMVATLAPFAILFGPEIAMAILR